MYPPIISYVVRSNWINISEPLLKAPIEMKYFAFEYLILSAPVIFPIKTFHPINLTF